MALHQAHIKQNNGVKDFTIPLTNRLYELIILFLNVKTEHKF